MESQDDPMVVRALDEILPLAMRPTPSGARLDLRVYFSENKEGQSLSVAVTDADDKPRYRSASAQVRRTACR